jgi:putative ABC transport system permease protein
MVLFESGLIALVGGALGLWLATLVVGLDLTSGLILLYIPMMALVMGAVIALATGMLAGLIPALNAMRLNVATALRRL